MNHWPAATVWVLLIGFSLLLSIAPWLPPTRKPAVVKIDLDNCNGCERCVEDCPFGALQMAPRSDGKKYASEAVVSDSLCLSCGICVGSCPTATPFRKRSALTPGIDLPDQSVASIREMVTDITRDLEGGHRVLIFGCDGSDKLEKFGDSETAVVNLTCVAQLPPAFVDWVLSRDLADGVILSGCAHNDCQFRLGARWTEQHKNRERDPRLRRRVDTENLAMLWADPWADFPDTATALASFRKTLSAPYKISDHETSPQLKPNKHPLRPFGAAVAWGLFAVSAVVFTIWPRFSQLQEGNAIISLTFSRAGQRVEECRKLSQEELNKLPPNMRKPTDCPRERHPVVVSFNADGQTLYQQSLQPSGFWKDGESTIYYRIEIPAGSHELFIGMNDSGREQGFDFSGQTEFTLAEGQHVVVEFDHLQQTFIFR